MVAVLTLAQAASSTKREMTRVISIVVVAVLVAILMADGANAATGDGTGTMTVSPTTAIAGSAGNSFTFTFTAGNNNFGSGSQATILIPNLWTAPQTTSSTSSGYVSISIPSGGAGCGAAALGTISGSGPWTIPINIKCNANKKFNLTYAGGATKVTAATAARVYNFTTQTAASGGTLTNISTQPNVTVNPAAASKLAFTVQPSTTTAGSAISPAVNVSVEDAYGNVNTSSTASISIAISSSGTLSGTTTVSAVNGVASFSNLVPTKSGSYNLFANNSIGLTNATSNSFTVNNPSPTTTSISPSSKTVGSSAFTMNVTGTNFVSSSYVQLDGANRTTTYLNSTNLSVTILSSDMTTAGTHSITVINPTPGGGTSNAQTFAINNPSPTTASISPSSAIVGSSPFTMTIFGTNFVTTSYAQFDGTNRTTTYVNGTTLTASILASDMTSAGTHSITVVNPTPGGGTSNTQTFTVNDEIIDVTLSNTPVVFGNVSAGSSIQSSLPLIATIQNTTNVNVNLTLNGSDLTYSTYSFGVGTLTYSNSSTGTRTSMTTSFPNPPYSDWINITKLVTTSRSIYLWISIPSGQKAGAYNSTINVQAQKYI